MAQSLRRPRPLHNLVLSRAYTTKALKAQEMACNMSQKYSAKKAH